MIAGDGKRSSAVIGLFHPGEWRWVATLDVLPGKECGRDSTLRRPTQGGPSSKIVGLFVHVQDLGTYPLEFTGQGGIVVEMEIAAETDRNRAQNIAGRVEALY